MVAPPAGLWIPQSVRAVKSSIVFAELVKGVIEQGGADTVFQLCCGGFRSKLSRSVPLVRILLAPPAGLRPTFSRRVHTRRKPNSGAPSQANLSTSVAAERAETHSLRRSFSKPQDFGDLVRISQVTEIESLSGAEAADVSKVHPQNQSELASNLSPISEPEADSTNHRLEGP